MPRILTAIALLTMMATPGLGVSIAFAANWNFGCDYNKCVSACSKDGNKYCAKICDNKFREKPAGSCK
jgi:hypothetical protein